MATKELVHEILPPTDGINIAVDETQLGDKETSDMGGFEMDEYGLLSIPFPDKDLGAIASTSLWLSAHVFYRETFSTQLIVHMSDGTLRYSTDFATAGTATWTTITSGLSTIDRMSFVTAFGYVYMSNGTDDLRRWSGTTLTNYASAPKVRYLALWKDTVWGSGTDANPDRVYKSAPGDGTSWPALDFVDVEKGAGYGVSALLATDTALVVFKFYKIHTIYDPIEFSNRILDDAKGCIGWRTVVNHQGQVYYLSHLGICRFYTDGPGEVVSQKIAPLFHQYMDSDESDILRWTATSYEFVGWSFQNYVAFLLPSSNNIVQTVMYYPSLPNKPWIFGANTTQGARVGIPFLGRDKVPRLYAVDTGSSAHLYRRYDVAATSAINAYWYTPWFDFGDNFSEKLIYEIEILSRGIINLAYQRDWVTDTTTDPSLATPESNQLALQHFNVEFYGKAFRLKFYSTSDTTDRQQYASGGVYGTALKIRRYQAAISKVRLRARKLGSNMR